ncbi:MAG: heme-binding protein [Candidatus Tectomicrobia bacterium]
MLTALLLPSLIAGCGGSSGADGGCTGFCANATTFLTVQDVERIISQTVAEATARGVPATVAVVDRVGNVLGVFRMTSADPDATITSGRGVVGGASWAVSKGSQ